MKTIKEYYEQMGGNYEDVSRRLGNEERIRKILGMLLKDDSIRQLSAALENKDYETAFRAAHTLKGVAQNLGLTELADVDSQLTEVLRAKHEDDRIPQLMEETQRVYDKVKTVIEEMTELS